MNPRDCPAPHGGGGSTFFDNVQTMGIVNALKTGNMHIDMILALCIPLLLRYLIQSSTVMEKLFQRFLMWLRGPKDHSPHYHNRYIVSQTKTHNSIRSGSHTTTEDHNKFLLQAINLYLHRQVKLNLRDANIDLSDMIDQNGGRLTGPTTLNSIGSVLRSLRLIKKPLANEWHCIGSYGPNNAKVSLRIEVVTKSKDKQNGEKNDASDTYDENQKDNAIHKYHLRSTDGAAVDAFLGKAYNWYTETLREKEDNSRYLYELKSTGYRRYVPPDQDNHLLCKYKRYKLSDEKTFDSLFFRDKESLLELLQHFNNSSGKYAIKGYPKKLGILLHGPAGTGKVRLSEWTWMGI